MSSTSGKGHTQLARWIRTHEGRDYSTPVLIIKPPHGLPTVAFHVDKTSLGSYWHEPSQFRVVLLKAVSG